MLPRPRRLRRPAEFSLVLSQGRRARSGLLAVHLLSRDTDQPARVGFVVSGKVGNSVVRHRVTRRLREQVRPQLQQLAPGYDLVVRALPAAATASSAELADSLAAALRKSGSL